MLACAAASALLAASQFTNMFELTPAGGVALRTIEASDQHGYATLVLAISSLVMLVVAVTARGEALAQGACFGVAVCGVIALLIFLVIDLPDANSIGAVDDDSFIDARAKPAAGFWFELAGSLLLTACGVALATIRARRAPAPERRGQQRPAEAEAPEEEGARSLELR